MLVLRDAHMEAFERAMEDGFKARALAHLRERYPTQSGPRTATEMRGIVTRGLETARALGFATEAQVIGFIELYFLWGDDFQTKGKAAEILARSDSPEERLGALRAAGFRT